MSADQHNQIESVYAFGMCSFSVRSHDGSKLNGSKCMGENFHRKIKKKRTLLKRATF